jgi:hypothetical protein
MRISRKEMILLGVGGVVVLTTIAFSWIRPQLERLRLISDELMRYSKTLSRYEETLQSKDLYKRRLEEVNKHLEDVRRVFFISKTPTQATNSLLNNLERIAKRTNVEIETKNPLPSQHKDGTNIISISLTLRCRSYDLIDFLYRLENDKKFLDVPYLNITPHENGKLLDVALTVSSLQLEPS